MRSNGLISRISAFSVRRTAVVVGLWVVAAVALNVSVPQLEDVVERDSTSFIPADAPAAAAQYAMERAFGSTATHSYAYIVMERRGGLTPADADYYRDLAHRLHGYKTVTAVQDMSGDPRAFASVTSTDGAARYLVVGMSGQTGAPSGTREIGDLRAVVHDGVPSDLRVEVTGTSATIADATHQIESKLVVITAATVLLIAVILYFFFRSIAVTALGLAIIGLSLACARGATAWFGLHVFAVSTFTGSFLTAVVVGAGTDYFIFTLSRYYDHRRSGAEPIKAARLGATRIGPVIVGSAFTVMVANAAAIVADIAFYRTTGPAIAVAVGVTLLISLTLIPALIAFFGHRGWLEPPAQRSSNYWKRTARRVVGRPAAMCAGGLVPLVLLAVFAPQLLPINDQTRNQPRDTESNRGYRTMAAHFPMDEVAPEFLVVTSDVDMRTTKRLAALEQMAQNVARVPGVAQIRGVTRPQGTPITEATLAYQAGEVGDQIATSGVIEGVDSAAAGAQQLLSGIDALRSGIADLDTGATNAHAGSAQLALGARQLAAGLDFAASQTAVAVDGLGKVYAALQSSLTCGLDPFCKGARDGIFAIWTGERDQLLPGLRTAAAAAHDLATGQTSLTSGLARLDAGLATAHAGTDTLANGLRSGASRSAADAKKLHEGLAAAAKYLRDAGHEAGGSPSAAGFYVPASMLNDADFRTSSQLLLSADGKTARYLILGDDWPFTRTAMKRSQRVAEAAQAGLVGTALAHAQVRASGQGAFNRDLADLNHDDFIRTAVVAFTTVLLILLALLRAPFAALFLVASVVLSYAAAMGLGVLIWQILLDTPLDWTAASIAFILLVAVGSDYNLLLMKRVQEIAENGADARSSIAQAVSETGSVITTAGVIFAASMFALMAGQIVGVSQTGSIVGAGLLLDTFIVRTLLVPAGAALIGPRLWWPRRSAAL